MIKPTPSPWRLDDEQREVRALKVKLICQVPGGGIISTGVDKANAALIAAAPELLAALQDLIPLIEASFPAQQRIWLSEARAAIAKATGA